MLRYSSIGRAIKRPIGSLLWLVLLFASLLAIALAGKGCLHALLLTRLQVVGVTLYFLDDVLLLDLPLKPAQRVLEWLAFLYTYFCQKLSTSKPAWGAALIILEMISECSIWLEVLIAKL